MPKRTAPTTDENCNPADQKTLSDAVKKAGRVLTECLEPDSRIPTDHCLNETLRILDNKKVVHAANRTKGRRSAGS